MYFAGWGDVDMLKVLRLLPLLLAAQVAGLTHAAEVVFNGTIGKKGIFVINGGRPQVLDVGAVSKEGVTLIALQGGDAVVSVQGNERRLTLGGQPVAVGEGSGGAREIRLIPDARGHYFVDGSINRASVRFLVDTGASHVSISVADAQRAGLNYLAGRPTINNTANGPVNTWIVRADRVSVAGLTLHQVDVAVHDSELPIALLGMSFLRDMRLKSEAGYMLLAQPY